MSQNKEKNQSLLKKSTEKKIQNTVELSEINEEKKTDTTNNSLTNFSAALQNKTEIKQDVNSHTLIQQGDHQQPTTEQKNETNTAAINTFQNMSSTFDWGINYVDRVNQEDDAKSDQEERHPCECECCDDLPFQIHDTWKSICNFCCG